MTAPRLANPLKIEIEAADNGWILRSLRWELPRIAPTWSGLLEILRETFEPNKREATADPRDYPDPTDSRINPADLPTLD